MSVASINIGKHIDKMEDDKKKVSAFPVRVGQTFARYANIASIVIAYGVIFLSGCHWIFSTLMLLVIFAAQRHIRSRSIDQAAPRCRAQGFETFWPTWFSGFCFYHNRMFGGLFILGIFLDTVARKLMLPININMLGAIASGLV
ncbi:hypothetical protein [Candidatus Villigracilis saccharophilus]|uniref:hypothetical protein n=1 Tax=Candidatus Villigracilis saccharophilus TaxID=3140684 RepID=UPI003135F68A|nr:hypothetical protein [Anaerolineales bacterium]